MEKEGSRITRPSDTTIDRVRDFWDNRPCNIKHSTQPLGTVQYFNEVEHRKYFVEPHIRAFANFSAMRGKKVLEIGCGIGTDTISFAKNGAWVTAIDLSPRSIDIATQRAEVFGLSGRIDFYVGNAESLSDIIPPQKYDLVYSFGVLHHTPHPDRALKQIREHYTHHSTILKIMLYHKYSWKVLWIMAKYGKWRFCDLENQVARYSEAQTGSPVTHIYSQREVKDLLNSCGFRTYSINVEHIFPYRIDDYIQYEYKKVWYFRYLPDTLFHWLESKLGWHLCITALADLSYNEPH